MYNIRSKIASHHCC